MQESNIKIGTLFRYNKRLSIHDDVHCHIGIVLDLPTCRITKQYKAQVSHKTLWITPWSMEEL